MADAGRWLNPHQAADYVGVRVDQLPRLVKAGKLPAPSYHFGPRSARYDREALDRLFLGSAASVTAASLIQDACNDIIAEANARRAAQVGRRNRQGIPLFQGSGRAQKPVRG